MRWKKPKHGEHRVIKRFLFLPLEIRGNVRWLEVATIGQEYNQYKKCWDDVEWLYI